MNGVTLALTGDILPTRELSPVPESAKEVFDLIEKADFAVGNFEMPLTDKGSAVEKLLNIRAHPGIGASLPVLGLDLVTVANNHAVDYGWEGLAQTVEVLRASGLRVVGAGRSVDEARQPEVAAANGKKIGVIGFSCLLPTGMAAASQRPGISPIHVDTSYEIDPYYQMEEPGDISVVKVRTQARSSDVAAAASAVKALKQRCDVVIVTIHWGFGSGEDIAEYQPPLARRLIDAGADVIHGHHPHAIHAVGFYKGRPILFSLGTLVGQQVFLDASPAVKTLWAGMSPDGYIATLTVSDEGGLAIGLVPTTLDPDRLPVLATGADFKRIEDRLVRLSAPHGAVIERHGKALRARAA
ncbi:MAG: CapA family protein [Parvibaculaceae bacterium]